MNGTSSQHGYRFGTFKGVYLPSILTILGVIMYLRFGWVLGQVGLAQTLIIVTMATSITLLTGLSLAALATNMRVGGGGAYYIISRSLGLEAGAAVGLPLYLAQALGISFYITGFSESVCSAFPQFDPRWVGVITLTVLALLAWISANLALKSQLLVLGLIIASLTSFALGRPPAAGPAEVQPLHAFPFWAVFAVFFPAVTGIEAGIAMSGDLKNPARSLPLGTIGAVLTGFAIYLLIPTVLHHWVRDSALLASDPLVMRRVARWGDLILYGVWAASLSSAMGSLLGAPRTLQALARDHVVPRFVGRGYGKGKDPRIATSISFLIGLGGILLGSLNLIAPILSMFFLTSYALLNLSAGLEETIGAASWRPKFRVPATVSLAGFLACLVAMLMINAGATLIAGVVAGSVYYVMKRRSLRARWGDMRRGLMMHITRELLYRMAGQPQDERTWAPNLLVLSGTPTQRWYLIELADAIAQEKGFLTIVSLLPEASWSPERGEKLGESIRAYLAKRDIRALVRVRPAGDVLAGVSHVIRNYGFGPLAPNTVLVGETERPENFVEYARMIELVVQMRRNLVIVREAKEEAEPVREKEEKPRIDVWCAGHAHNVGFMLALAYLLGRGPDWRDVSIVLKMVVDTPEEQTNAEKQLREYAVNARIGSATETLVLLRNGRPVFDVIRASSQDASMVFLGMRRPAQDETPEAYSEYYQRLLTQTEGLPVTALIMAAENVPFHRMFTSPEAAP